MISTISVLEIMGSFEVYAKNVLGMDMTEFSMSAHKQNSRYDIVFDTLESATDAPAFYCCKLDVADNKRVVYVYRDYDESRLIAEIPVVIFPELEEMEEKFLRKAQSDNDPYNMAFAAGIHQTVQSLGLAAKLNRYPERVRKALLACHNILLDEVSNVVETQNFIEASVTTTSSSEPQRVRIYDDFPGTAFFVSPKAGAFAW